ncbi:MAG TPA: response regulator [Gemmataceae bacterium]|nr:response regulator [Gemmataceae bacterium]
MVNLLVVDDSALDRYVAGALLEEHTGWIVSYAEDGKEGLSCLRRQLPDLVLTDLQMPEINGLELVEAIRSEFSSVPVILMTAHGSEEIAVAALQKGASSYVPKRNLARDLVATVQSVLSVTQTNRDQQFVLSCLESSDHRFVLGNDPLMIQPLIGHLQDLMWQMKLTDKSGLIRIGTALHEALANALEHGNLELGSELREREDRTEYLRLLEERRNRSPYHERRIRIHARFARNEVAFVIRDEGPGFDTSALGNATDPPNIDKLSGRGIFLIRTFMDEVHFNAAGNEITMIKRK